MGFPTGRSAGPHKRVGVWCRREAGFDDGEGLFDLGITLAARRRVKSKQGQRHFVDLFCTAVVAQGGQPVGGALAGDNGAENTLPSVPRNITAGLRDLAIHLYERLLPMEDMGSTMLDELGTMA